MKKKYTIKELANNPDIYRSFYIYTLKVPILAVGAIETVTVNIEADSQFIWTKTTSFTSISNATQTNNNRVIPLATVQIRDSGSARQFFDSPQQINSISGQGNIPFILPSPFIFNNNSNINATFVNTSAATEYTDMSISLIGFRVYETGNSTGR